MERMYLSCGCEMPTNLTKPREKTLHRRLVNALEAIDRRWRVSKHFNGLLNDFRQADQDDRSWDVVCIEEAQHHFTNAKGLQQEKRFDEAKLELEAAIKQCDSILDVSSTPKTVGERQAPAAASVVQALRRKSGAVTQMVDLELSRRKIQSSDARNLNGLHELKDVIRSQAEMALGNGLRGLDMARNTVNCMPLVQPLIYNTLASLGYLRLAKGKPLNDERTQLFNTLRHELITLDTAHEDISELKRDSHGYHLLDKEI